MNRAHLQTLAGCGAGGVSALLSGIRVDCKAHLSGGSDHNGCVIIVGFRPSPLGLARVGASAGACACAAAQDSWEREREKECGNSSIRTESARDSDAGISHADLLTRIAVLSRQSPFLDREMARELVNETFFLCSVPPTMKII